MSDYQLNISNMLPEQLWQAASALSETTEKYQKATQIALPIAAAVTAVITTIAIYRCCCPRRVVVAQPNLGEGLVIQTLGNYTTISNSKSLFLHLNKYLGNNLDLRKYNGVQDLERLDQLLHSQNYTEVLNYVWSEKDLDTRIAWLKDKAGQNHVPLMLELAYSYILRSPTIETFLNFSSSWIIMAMKRIEIDAECTSDRSVQAVDQLAIIYRGLILEKLLNKSSLQSKIQNVLQNMMEFYQQHETIAKSLLAPFKDKKVQQIPSPEWIFSQGLGAGLGIQNSIQKKDWDRLRKEKAEEIAKNIQEDARDSLKKLNHFFVQTDGKTK